MPSIELSTTSQFTDNLTKSLGHQTLKAGFQWQRLGIRHSSAPDVERSLDVQRPLH